MQSKLQRPETRPGKHSKLEVLPNQRTLHKLVSGDTAERSMNNYAKVTPSGIEAVDAPDINELSQVKY